LERPKKTTPSTWSNQAQLPRLPVPDLNESCEKLLQTLEPLAESPEQFQSLKSDVQEFLKPGGRGEELQKRLLEHEADCAKKVPAENWLEKWWLNLAYLAHRDPLPIYLSVHMGITTSYPVSRETRAATFAVNMIKFKEILEREELPPQRLPKMGNIPLCMDQFRRFFSCTRIPHEHMDELVIFPKEVSRHLIVLHHDHIYSIDAYPQGRHITELELKSQLDLIVSEERGQPRAIPVSLLTAGNRDHWARTREQLMEISATNKQNLETIESGLFVVCLDDDFPTTITEEVEFAMHSGNGRNRWFDKNYNIITFLNGHVAVNGEHTPYEATQPAHLFEWVLKKEQQSNFAAFNLDWKRPTFLERPKKLKWDLTPEILEAIKVVETEFLAHVKRPDVDLFQFTGYGNQLIKKVARVSPDSWMQFAIQLAYYRMYKKVVPTYETASLRQFLNGRTETCRPATVTSVEFCKKFDDPAVSRQEKLELFRKSVAGHINYMMECFNGRGWDRHVLGLRVLAATDETTPALFNNELFKRANKFTLSTSNISPGRYFCGGFGIIDPDGYGVCYLIEKEYIWINICSDRNCKETTTKRFKKILIQTLFDLEFLFSSQNPL